jgi:hypothetical protein
VVRYTGLSSPEAINLEATVELLHKEKQVMHETSRENENCFNIYFKKGPNNSPALNETQIFCSFVLN